MYAVAGYMTIYNYYAYPEKVRPRVRYIAQLEPFVSLRMDADLSRPIVLFDFIKV